MNEPMIILNGKKYSIEEATKVGIIPKLEPIINDNSEGEHDIEIIIDEDTKSFRIQINEGEALDIPKSILIDVFEVSSFRSIKKIIEEDGVDYDTLEYISKNMGLLMKEDSGN